MFKLTHANTILRLADGATIPPAADNADYRAYLEWLAEGNAPEVADPKPEPPLNEYLEKEFAKLIPKHLGQAYLTDDVIDDVLAAKLKITEGNKLATLGLPIFGKNALRALIKKLPVQMQADAEYLLTLFPGE